MTTLQSAAEFVATASAALFAGAAVYVSLVEHPARMECGSELAVTQFGPSYRRGAVMQASLAVLGCLAGIAAWAAGAGLGWLIGGLLLGSLIPLTLLVIFPTNKALLDPSLDKSSPRATELLTRWGKLHVIRTCTGLAALFVFLWS